jgi:hypothetical protein
MPLVLSITSGQVYLLEPAGSRPVYLGRDALPAPMGVPHLIESAGGAPLGTVARVGRRRWRLDCPATVRVSRAGRAAATPLPAAKEAMS